MAMLYMPRSFPATDLDAWFKPSARSEKEQALSTLDRLHILASKREDDRSLSYSLSEGFQRSLRHAIEGSGTHRTFGVPATKAERGEKRLDIDFLDQHARQQWEGILFFMVSGAAGFAPGSVRMDVGPGTKKLLTAGDLIRTVHGTPRITKDGFTFVLQETNAQVWNLLIIYLKMVNDVRNRPYKLIPIYTDSPQLGMSETEVLSFLFMLGSLELGQDYSTSTLSPTQLQMLDDLSAMGIVYRSSKESRTFYPTRLATTLTSESGALPGSDISTSDKTDTKAQNKGFIIVETNYRLYAYTNSLIQIAILSLFTKLQHRFPNLVSGKLTKDSVHRAVQSGITSAQIISYLTTYAHPQMQKSNPPLPPTVMDQIRLWEYEGERVEVTNGYLMREFGNEAEYKDVRGYASALGVLVWQNDVERCFFVSHVEQISSYMKAKKDGRGKGGGR
jgi:transcription initiation factor TFIIH subunit 4